MTSPFKIDGPAMVSFSGGRTSGLMLRRILDEGLQPDVHVVFANTGKERSETLDFVRDCGERWGVTIHWVERTSGGSFVEVDHATASRDGRPFREVLAERSYLPNPVTRFCTSELKIRVQRDWMRAQGLDDGEWTNVVGLRADEMRRVVKMRARNNESRWDIAMPLADAGVTQADVMAFWAAQPFDLQLKSYEGNCDLCFLKGVAKRKRIMRDNPGLAEWWIAREAEPRGTKATSARFRADTPSYARLLESVRQQPLLMVLDDDPTDGVDCACTD